MKNYLKDSFILKNENEIHDFLQFVRGELYIFIDYLLSNKYDAKILSNVIVFLEEFIKFAIFYLEFLPICLKEVNYLNILKIFVILIRIQS